MLVKVTQKHIDAGKVGKCRECPIALALQDCGVVTAVYNGYILTNGATQVIHLSRSAKRFIKKFDSEQRVKPFNFIIKGLS